MRTAFVESLIRIARKDKRIFLLTGDLGYGTLEKFKQIFPDRFINMGVAEANMIGAAAGLAMSGKIPYVYSIATFAVMRGLEQIRNDVCYQRLNVRVIGVGSGLIYSLYGATHQSIDDIAVMRSLPNMTIISPADPLETDLAVLFSLTHTGPIYLRIASKGEPVIHEKNPDFKFGKGITVINGSDLTILATGNMLQNAYSAAKELSGKRISVRLISMPFIKPIDEKIILKSARETRAIFTVEEHSLLGGLGTAVAEVLAESPAPKVLFKKIALPDAYPAEVGGRVYLREIYGLSPNKIAANILKSYQKEVLGHVD